MAKMITDEDLVQWLGEKSKDDKAPGYLMAAERIERYGEIAQKIWTLINLLPPCDEVNEACEIHGFEYAPDCPVQRIKDLYVAPEAGTEA